MFISFEGIEGSGKSTQAKIFYQRLLDEGYKALLTYEPGDTPLGKRLRELILHEKMDHLTEVLLFSADRREHVMTLIRPALERQHIVVSDRYYHSTIAYQVYGRQMNRAWVDEIHRVILGGTVPQRVYLLDIDVHRAFQRKRHDTFDRIESETVAFHERVRDGFLQIAHHDSSVFVLEADLSKESLHQLIWDDFCCLIGEQGGRHVDGSD